MAILYVSSVDGDNTTPPSVSWWNGSQTTYASIGAPSSSSSDGALQAATDEDNIIYVDSNHDYSSPGGNHYYYNLGNDTSKVKIICVDRNTGERTTGAKETVGASGGVMYIIQSMSGTDGIFFVYFFGIEFTASPGATGPIVFFQDQSCLRGKLIFDSCILSVRTTNTNSSMFFGNTTLGASAGVNVCEFVNSTLNLGNNTADIGMVVRGCVVEILIRKCRFSYYGSNKPLAILGAIAEENYKARIEVVDSNLEDIDSGAVIDVGEFTAGGSALIKNCSFNNNLAFTTGEWQNLDFNLQFINTDSSDTKYTFQNHNYLGSTIGETGIYLSGEAKFNNLGISWKVDTATGCNDIEPHATPWITRWHNGTTGSSGTLDIVYDSTSGLSNKSCWLELEYVSGSNIPLGNSVSTKSDWLFMTGDGVELENNNLIWDGTGGFANPRSQQIGYDMTNIKSGPVKARLLFAESGRTVYVNPLIRFD